MAGKTKWIGRQKVFGKNALIREVSALPLKAAEKMSERLDRKQKTEKRSGTLNKKRNKKRAKRGSSERYADDSGKTSLSKEVKRTGDFSAKLSFESPTAKILISDKVNLSVIKQSDEKEAQDYLDKESAKLIARLSK